LNLTGTLNFLIGVLEVIRMKRSILLLSLFLTACTQDDDRQLGADIILTNARVYSMRWEEPDLDGTLSSEAPNNGEWQPDANAVVIRNSTITFVGETSEALNYQGENTQIIDLAGATILPGLVDSHTHV